MKTKLTNYFLRRYLQVTGGALQRGQYQLHLLAKKVQHVGAPSPAGVKKMKAGETYVISAAGELSPGPPAKAWETIVYLETNPLLAQYGVPSWSYRELHPGDSSDTNLNVVFICAVDLDVAELSWLVRVTTDGSAHNLNMWR